MKLDLTTLPSGLRVVTACLPGFQSASTAVFVRAGSRCETEANGGIAHFLEHMAFKGTAKRSALQIAREVEELGSYINAYTGTEVTAYYVNGLGRNVAQSVAILGDVLTNSAFDPKEIEVEKGVILQEINRHLDNPMSVAFDGFGLTAFPEQALGRPILGKAEFIQTVNRDHFVEFVGQNYHASNMVVVGTGAVQHEDFVSMVAEHFAGLATGQAPAWEPAVYHGGIHRETTRPFEQVTVLLGFPSVAECDARFWRHNLLADVLGGGMSSPLFQEVREKRGLVYSTHAWSDHATDHGLLIIEAGTTTAHVDECIKVACEEIAKLTRHVEERDLSRAKNSALVGLATRKEKPFALAESLATGLFQHGTLRAPEERMAEVEAVTLDEIRSAAEEIIASTPTISLVGPAPDTDYLGMVKSILG